MNTITNTNTSTESETARLRALCDVIEQADLEAEERRALERMTQESGINHVENLLSGQMTRLVTTLTPDRWNAMSDVEKRNMARWLERRVKLFSEKLCFVRRHLAAEPDVPAYLKKEDVA